jgi:hypothetical protein
MIIFSVFKIHNYYIILQSGQKQITSLIIADERLRIADLRFWIKKPNVADKTTSQ